MFYFMWSVIIFGICYVYIVCILFTNKVYYIYSSYQDPFYKLSIILVNSINTQTVKLLAARFF